MINKKNIDKFIGQYKAIYYGHSTNSEIRARASSGGITTTIIRMMLKRGLADGAVVLGFNEKKPWLPEFMYAKTEHDVMKSIGSKYLKTEVVDMIKLVDKILEKSPKERIIIVGLPCQIAYFRKAKKYKDNVVLLLGLFCGWNIGFEATEYLIKKTGCKDKKQIREIDYRGGPYPGGFTVNCSGKKKGLKKYNYDLVNLIFVSESCLSCNFYSNEFADISIGDAWIDEKNNSTIIVRTEKGKKIIDAAVREKEITIKKAKVDDFFIQHKHNFMFKKKKKNIKIIRLLHYMMYKLRPFVPFKLLGYVAKIRWKLKKRHV